MNIALLLYHHVSELEVAGPYAAFCTAKPFLEDEDLKIYTVAKSRNSVETSGGLIITPHWAFASAPQPEVLVVPGGAGAMNASRDKAVSSYVQQQAPELKVILGISSGVLLLGELGFLRNLKATTHPSRRDDLLNYEAGEILDARVVKNDRLWCASGPSAGVDAALELLLSLYGTALASRVAEQLDLELWQPQEHERAQSR